MASAKPHAWRHVIEEQAQILDGRCGLRDDGLDGNVESLIER